MDNKNSTFDLIERYFDGDLSGVELSDFEKRMKTDKGFSKQVDEQRLTHKALDVYSQLKTKDQVKEIYQEELFSAKRRRLKGWSIAASIAVLIIAGIYFSATSNYSNKAILANHFETFPDRITTMGSDANDQLAEGLKAYNDSDYEKAINVFSALPDTMEQFGLVKIYLGISQLQTEKINEAINTFKQLETSQNNISEVARWYLALSYLKSNDIQNCTQLLEQIVSESSFQSENARQLLEAFNHPFRKLPGVN